MLARGSFSLGRLVGMPLGTGVQPQVDARVLRVGNEVMVLARLDDKDIPRDHRVRLTVQLHHGLALKDDKDFVIIGVDVYIRAAGAIVCMRADVRGFV